MLEVLKVTVAVILFYCLMFCGHQYWLSKESDSFLVEIIYITLGWIGVYLIQALLNN